MYEFEVLRFSIPIIFWMLYFWEKENRSGFLAFVFLAILVREEVGVTVMMFGVYLFLFRKKRLAGVLTAIFGFGAFVIITQKIMPNFSTIDNFQHVAAQSFSKFGTAPADVVVNVIKHPVLALKIIFTPIKIANIYMLFLPLIFIPILSPTILMCTLGSFGIGLLSNSITHISYMLYYVSPAIPFIFYAFIRGWPKFLEVLEPWAKKRYSLINKNLNSIASFGVLSGLFAANIFFGPSPISLQFWSKGLKPAPFITHSFHYSSYKISEHHRRVGKFVSLIPDNAIVSTQQFLAPRLFAKQGIMIFPRLKSVHSRATADYVLFDKTNNGLKEISPAYINQSQFDLVEKNPENWNIIKSEDNFILYKRVNNNLHG